MARDYGDQEVSADNNHEGFAACAKEEECHVVHLMAKAFSIVWIILEKIGCLRDSSNTDRPKESVPNARTWSVRMEPLLGAPGLESVESLSDIVKLCRPASSSVGDMLNEADTWLSEARRLVNDLRNNRTYASVLFDVSIKDDYDNLFAKTWKDGLEKLAKAIVEIRLSINTLKNIATSEKKEQKVVLSIKPEDQIQVSINRPSEQVNEGISGKLNGHPWWCVPKLEVRSASQE